jgi:alkylhydroperoxidase family enzyme
MRTRYDSKTRALADAVLTGAGETPADLRRAVEANTAKAAGGERDAPGDVPEALARYVEKVARHAYKVTDEDVANLKDAGYSEDDLFEITLSAALGAGLARLEVGLRALEGGEE